MPLISIQFIKSSNTRTVSSTWTASLALSADAPPAGGLVFCSSPRLFHRDTKLHCRLSGLGTFSQLHLDPWLTAIYRDWQKTWHRDPPAGGTAPNQTAGPLASIPNAASSLLNSQPLSKKA